MEDIIIVIMETMNMNMVMVTKKSMGMATNTATVTSMGMNMVMGMDISMAISMSTLTGRRMRLISLMTSIIITKITTCCLKISSHVSMLKMKNTLAVHMLSLNS